MHYTTFYVSHRIIFFVMRSPFRCSLVHQYHHFQERQDHNQFWLSWVYWDPLGNRALVYTINLLSPDLLGHVFLGSEATFCPNLSSPGLMPMWSCSCKPWHFYLLLSWCPSLWYHSCWVPVEVVFSVKKLCVRHQCCFYIGVYLVEYT